MQFRALDPGSCTIFRIFESLAVADRYLRATNALWDSAVAERQGLYLKVLRPGELWELPDTDFPGSQSAPERSFLDEITLASDPD